MIPITPKVEEAVIGAGREAISFILTKTTGDNHPEYEKAIIKGTAAKIEELANADTGNAVKIYESLKIKREQRDFWNFSKMLHKVAILIKTKPAAEIKDDNDVFWGLIERSKEISNEEMQELIAKIIAGEYNSPGTYSMQTLQTIKMLGKDELELFEKICGFVINDSQIPEILFLINKESHKLLDQSGVSFTNFQLFQSLGLFLPNMMRTTVENKDKKNLKIVYFHRNILLSPISPKDEGSLEISTPNYYNLSPSGEQILKHLNPKYNNKYFIWLKENYKITNYKLYK